MLMSEIYEHQDIKTVQAIVPVRILKKIGSERTCMGLYIASTAIIDKIVNIY